jgi:hypothetical protein
MNTFSADEVAQHFGKQLDKLNDSKAAEHIAGLLNGEIQPDSFPKTAKWIQGCYNDLDDDEKILEAVNEVLEAYGTEGITPEGQVYPVAAYVNMGDTYEATVVYDIEEKEFILTNWGDWLEGWESEQDSDDAGDDDES